MDGAELEFDDEAIDAIAEKAIKRNTGARGLRTIVEEIMQDIMYDIPSDPTIKTVTITKECVTDNAEPKVVREEKKVKKAVHSQKTVEDDKTAC